MKFGILPHSVVLFLPAIAVANQAVAQIDAAVCPDAMTRDLQRQLTQTHAITDLNSDLAVRSYRQIVSKAMRPADREVREEACYMLLGMLRETGEIARDDPLTEPWDPGCTAEFLDVTMPQEEPPTGELKPLIGLFPEYPEQAFSAGQDGAVEVRFRLTTDGRVRRPSVVSSTDRTFEDSALEAIRSFRFVPKVVNGQAVPVEDAVTSIEFNYADEYRRRQLQSCPSD